MFGEINLDHFDELVEGYAVASAYADRLDALERDIAKIATRLGSSRPTISDFTDILESRMSVSDQRVRHVAWLMQHVFRCRAWCVNQSICLQKHGKKGYESPLVEQLRKMDIQVKGGNLDGLYDELKSSRQRGLKKIDVMMVDRAKRLIYLINGQAHSQTRRFSRGLRLQDNYETLFGAEDRFIINARCESASVARLHVAKDLIAAAVPQYDVKCLIALVADPGCGWRFQCHDVTGLESDSIRRRFLDLNDIAVFRTHRSPSNEGQPDDPFDGLPISETLDYLRSAPVDRPIRSMMILTELFKEQTDYQSNLVIKPAHEIALKIAYVYGISYPRDMYRHDLLELERARLVKRGRNRDNAYAITAKGVGRVFIMQRRFDVNHVADPDDLLNQVRRQGALWRGVNVL